MRNRNQLTCVLMKCQHHLPRTYPTQCWLKPGFYHQAQDASWGRKGKQRGLLKLRFLESSDCGRLSITFKKEMIIEQYVSNVSQCREKKKKIQTTLHAKF